MKTTAFLLRVVICFLLSQIPFTELENRVYSARMSLRGKWGPTQEFVIVDVRSEDFADPIRLQAIRSKLEIQKPLWIGNVPLASPGTPLKALPPDPDGILRKAVLKWKGVNGKSEPSLTYQAFRAVHGEDHSLPRPLRNQIHVPHLINFMGPPGSIPRCVPDACRNIRDKFVLLTDETESLTPLRTPVGEMPRSEVLANDLFTVVGEHPIYTVPYVMRAIVTIGMILVAAFYIIYYPVLLSAIAVSGTGVAVVIFFFQALFHFFSLNVPSVNIGGSFLITYLIFTGYRLAVQENLQWRSLKQAQYLRELDQMKSNFLSLVSHDLKTPIAKIQAVVERLRRELHAGLASDQGGIKTLADWRELVDSIENSNNELKHYITSILNLSKIESHQVILNKKSNDINLIIQQALKRLRSVAAPKNIHIEEILEPLFSIECDEDLVRQVLTNLLDNAIKYSPAQSRIIVRSTEEDGFVRVEIQDFGPGIPRDQLPLMFRKFSRFLRPIHEQVKGSGLGLYLSKYFIELHGGTISVHSVEGQGTTFSFTLPLQGAERETILG